MTGQSQPPKKQQGWRRSREEAEELFLSHMKLVPFVANQMAIEVTDDTIQDGYLCSSGNQKRDHHGVERAVEIGRW